MKTLRFVAYNHPCEPQRKHVYYMHVDESVLALDYPEVQEAYRQRAKRAMMESFWHMAMGHALPEMSVLTAENCEDDADWRAWDMGQRLSGARSAD